MSSKVLITQGTRPFAQRVARELSSPKQQVLFGSADEVPDVLLRTGNYLRIPHPSMPVFVHELLKICLDSEVDILIPMGKNELYPLAKARPLFAEYGVEVWVPDVADLAGLVIIESPPRKLPLLVVSDGVVVTGPEAGKRHGTLSGVFIPSDSGDEMALCCIAD
ncbi:hypothetical protein [Parapedobacter tibetensis]|uniref:hypothetical protein n=1 Tax=Parapedobacter tibetensis TaxID=2972951 RepID=UPI00214D2138|nr:hypothetical protein [Parapedobacter tibetensis]